jgi:hypothetical protein
LAGENAGSEGIREGMAGGHGIAREEGKRARTKEIQAGVGEPRKQTISQKRRKDAETLAFLHKPMEMPHPMG